MSYVDAFHDRTRDVIHVSERVNGKRVLVQHTPEYNFYYTDPKGKAKSIYGDPVTEVVCKNFKDFKKIKIDITKVALVVGRLRHKVSSL